MKDELDSLSGDIAQLDKSMSDAKQLMDVYDKQGDETNYNNTLRTFNANKNIRDLNVVIFDELRDDFEWDLQERHDDVADYHYKCLDDMIINYDNYKHACDDRILSHFCKTFTEYNNKLRNE